MRSRAFCSRVSSVGCVVITSSAVFSSTHASFCMQRGMHSGFDAAAVALRVRDELDGVTELACVAKVDRLDAVDALAVDVPRLDADLVGDGAEDRELVGGVEAFDVVRGVGLRVTGR